MADGAGGVVCMVCIKLLPLALKILPHSSTFLKCWARWSQKRTKYAAAAWRSPIETSSAPALSFIEFLTVRTSTTCRFSYRVYVLLVRNFVWTWKEVLQRDVRVLSWLWTMTHLSSSAADPQHECRWKMGEEGLGHGRVHARVWKQELRHEEIRTWTGKLWHWPIGT